MGMAASQARFLGLTARKTNVEYEGQQINQQRTALGNQSANYYNQMLGMSVPKPPSVNNFTKTVYSFEDGSLKNTITSLIARPGGEYTVSYLREWQDDFAAVSAAPALVTRIDAPAAAKAVYDAANSGTDLASVQSKAKIAYEAIRDDAAKTIAEKAAAKAVYDAVNALSVGTALAVAKSTAKTAYEAIGNAYMVGNDELRLLGSTPSAEQIKADPYLSSLSADQLIKLVEQEILQAGVLDSTYGQPTDGWVVRYVKNSNSGAYEPQFYNLDVLNNKNTTYNVNGQSQSNIPAYKMGTAKKTEEIKGIEARLEQDATGRIINITMNPNQPNEVKYALTTNTITDQAAYNDAMNQYEFDKHQYDQTIQEVNAKIEIIQVEDRNLELRLKQLDTEQNAISTEMDAVSKVIEKNVESTFKTFG
ncbi:MAG: hypothetical protein LBK53_02940 [Heliobacteriaceae bacterium]|jgi:hypothetical protein|nr:hypothetical protein [Heliobacteriaceae bacterium]